MNKKYITLATYIVWAIGAGVILFDWSPWCMAPIIRKPAMDYILREITIDVGRDFLYDEGYKEKYIYPELKGMFPPHSSTFKFIQTFYKSQRTPDQTKIYNLVKAKVLELADLCDGMQGTINIKLNE